MKGNAMRILLAIIMAGLMFGCEKDSTTIYDVEGDLVLNQNHDGTMEVGNSSSESTSSTETEIEDSESATIN